MLYVLYRLKCQKIGFGLSVGRTRAFPRRDSTLWRPVGAILLLLLPLIVAPASADPLPPWVLMWTIAFALFFGCKVLTWSRARDGVGSNLAVAGLSIRVGRHGR